jgi:hypothetical protein
LCNSSPYETINNVIDGQLQFSLTVNKIGIVWLLNAWAVQQPVFAHAKDFTSVSDDTLAEETLGAA